MPNNNNCGMHYIHYAKDKTAVHEFDYDNECMSRKKRQITDNVQQTSVWNLDGTPVIRSKKSKKAREKEKNAEVKKEGPQGKKTSFDILFEMDRNRFGRTKLTSQTKKLNAKRKALKKAEEAQKQKEKVQKVAAKEQEEKSNRNKEVKKKPRRKFDANNPFYCGIDWKMDYETIGKILKEQFINEKNVIRQDKDCIEIQLGKVVDTRFVPKVRYQDATERYCFEGETLKSINIYLGYNNRVQAGKFLDKYKEFADARWGKGTVTKEGHLIYLSQGGEIEASESGIVITPEMKQNELNK